METNENGNGQLVDYQEVQPAVINPMDAAPAIFKAGLDRRKENRDTLMEWIRSSLVEGRDYGSIVIRGQQSKPSLFKPGAEKIAGMLGLIPRFPNLDQYEDAVLEGREITTVILKCELQNQIGEVIGEGVGARAVEDQDRGDLNKALKMASKSAMIDATLRCAGISEVFTQDIEDTLRNAYQPEHNTTQNKTDTAATDKQIDRLGALVNDDRLTHEEQTKLRGALIQGLTKSRASEIMSHFFGESVRQNGEWVRVSEGVIANRS